MSNNTTKPEEPMDDTTADDSHDSLRAADEELTAIKKTIARQKEIEDIKKILPDIL